jgi:hypothetical protein
METVKNYLIDWAKHFIKNKDLVTRSIQSIEESKENADLLITRTDKTQYVYVEPILKQPELFFEKLNRERHITLFLLNCPDNIKMLQEVWNTIKHFSHLTIYFINPFSEETKWVIQPAMHERISDRDTFKTGLKSMSEQVAPITPEQLGKKIA